MNIAFGLYHVLFFRVFICLFLQCKVDYNDSNILYLPNVREVIFYKLMDFLKPKCNLVN